MTTTVGGVVTLTARVDATVRVQPAPVDCVVLSVTLKDAGHCAPVRVHVTEIGTPVAAVPGINTEQQRHKAECGEKNGQWSPPQCVEYLGLLTVILLLGNKARHVHCMHHHQGLPGVNGTVRTTANHAFMQAAAKHTAPSNTTTWSLSAESVLT